MATFELEKTGCLAHVVLLSIGTGGGIGTRRTRGRRVQLMGI
jgi:hypothetical protein